MSLERTATEVVREGHGISFFMRVCGSPQTVRIVVSEDALDADDATPNDDELLAQFEADREALEAVACEKYAHGRVAADGVIMITAADVIGFIG
jgi:hypothetical protein